MKLNKILILCLIIISTACDDFLEVNPKGEVVDKDLFNSSKGFEDAIYGCYATLNQDNLYGRDLAWYLTDVQAQYFKVNSTTAIRGISFAAKYDYEVNFQSLVANKWKDMYRNIGYVNNILAQLELDKNKKYSRYNYYKGELLGLRAFMHFELVKLFAEDIKRGPKTKGIPYVTKYTYSVTPFSLVEDVYKKIIVDLTEAEKLLANEKETFEKYQLDVYEFTDVRQIHFNLYAVKATLARVFWHKNDMPNALKYAKDVINSGKFELTDQTEIKDFLAGNISKKETIWGIYNSKYYETTKRYLYESITDASVSPFEEPDRNPESYQELFNYDMVDGQTGTDARLTHFRVPNDATSTKVRCLKVVDEEFINNNKETPYSRGLIEGISMIRIPEMYYIAAEALLTTDSNEARTYFDKVLKSRGIIPFAERNPKKELTIESINYERRKEFYCEGREWFNMKRQNRDIISNTESKTITASPKIYIWPIPNEESEYRY